MAEKVCAVCGKKLDLDLIRYLMVNVLVQNV